jgi:hypothetical protein
VASPNEKIAASLQKLKELQDTGVVAIKSEDLSRVHRERLLNNGFLREVVKGWHISTLHHEIAGDSTTWYTSYWDFCARYLEDRYKGEYCLSPEQSLILLSGNRTVPNQLLLRSPKGNNLVTEFIFNTSIFPLKGSIPENKEKVNGLNVYLLEEALVFATANFYADYPTDARAALLMVQDSSRLLEILISGGHSTKASRLVGAFINVGKEDIADEITNTMKTLGYVIRAIDPFTKPTPIVLKSQNSSPYSSRVKLMWHEMRQVVISKFPKEPGISSQPKEYIRIVDEIYTTDAYHSLSIEKYRVTPELIQKVSAGKWNTSKNREDQLQKDAMAARGYYQAYLKVKKAILDIYDDQNPGKVVESQHRDWYLELFAPSVKAGIIKPTDLAGYRNQQVFIAQSQHTPVNSQGLRDMMSTFFDLLKHEKEASVRAVLGHFIFVYIHPYMDGNGRLGRFLMNVMLASGGYPWTVIPVEQRDEYMNVLEEASVNHNIGPFAEYLSKLVQAGLDGSPVAKI